MTHSPGSPGMSRSDHPIPGEDGPQSSTATSPSLLERVKADDPAAWDRLVGLYAPLVYRWCRRADLPEQEIADVFQDVFYAVATHIAAFRREGAGDTFRGWLRTISTRDRRTGASSAVPWSCCVASSRSGPGGRSG